ncbi:MAG: twin-arginine translocation signal domain-containing protein [bacterium]
MAERREFLKTLGLGGGALALGGLSMNAATAATKHGRRTKPAVRGFV